MLNCIAGHGPSIWTAPEGKSGCCAAWDVIDCEEHVAAKSGKCTQQEIASLYRVNYELIKSKDFISCKDYHYNDRKISCHADTLHVSINFMFFIALYSFLYLF